MLALTAPRKKHPVDAFQVGDQVIFRLDRKSYIGIVLHRWICHHGFSKSPAVLFDVTHRDRGFIPFYGNELLHTKQKAKILIIDGPHSNRIVLGHNYLCEIIRRSDAWDNLEVVPFAIVPTGYLCRPHRSNSAHLTPRQMDRVRVLTANQLGSL